MASALIAAAPHNERRMFTIPEFASAFVAVPAPEETSLRSAIMGYLRDGCAPEFVNSKGDLTQLVNRADCGPGRSRNQGSSPFAQKPTATPNKSPVAPTAFFAEPEAADFVSNLNSPLIVTQPTLEPSMASFTPPTGGTGGGGGFIPGIPIPLPDFVPPVFGSVPEPSTWALMIAGFGLAGTMMRRRNPVKVTFAAG
ncbi:PEPxxWA-CTERM sorting domain-containing protein [Sphingobium sp. B8D3D]|uniref:PEPxxWA-CTERM sorting domain-containing protein n=2 Tax=unclassified Sphingobium TaxID=2611147 RepID=UPI0022251D68|nr:PEPxxWA-CTERM sorting domain-containing protein [Sphingobium sp. B8D3D]MCW2415310.1 hypothetical protein [Sphingobium sp. B8D3A]